MKKPSHRGRVLPWLKGVGLALLFLLFAACSRGGGEAEFIFINGPEPESLDPHIITGQPEYRLCQALGEGLTARNGLGQVEPGVAESWEVSKDGLRYRFTLRPNARWSNGEPIDAPTFARSWQRALSPQLGSKYAELLYPIRNAQAFNEGRLNDFNAVGVRALDARTLEVELESPTPYFLDLVALPTLHPVYFPSIEQWGEDWIKPGKLVSNGAYRLLRWRIDDHILLERNPHYWRAETVALERVKVLATQRATTAFNLFYAGLADLIMDKSLIPAFFVEQVRQKPFFHASACLATYFYRFNVTKPPLNDVRVRRALAMAVDRERIVQHVTRAGEPAAASLVPPGIPGYEPHAGLRYDVAEARRLLAEAGYPNGRGFPSISILYNTSEQNEHIATAIQAMWREALGVTVTLRKQEWKVYLNTLNALEFEIARSSWVGDYNDPNTFLDMFVTGRGNNRTGWSNAEYDKLMERARNTSAAGERMRLMHDAERLLVAEEMPIFPIYFYVGIALYHADRLGGYRPNVIDEHPIREMYFLDGSRPQRSAR